MESSPSQQHQQQSHLPSPTSHSSSNSSTSSNSNSHGQGQGQGQTPILPPSPKPVPTRSEQANPYPTTFVQADTASFKQVVQMLTGSPKPKPTHTHTQQQQPDPSPPATTRPTHNIPPIKSIPNKKSQPSSGFKLYERRNSLKNLKINPIFAPPGSGFSPRNKPEILSPSILDFPSLVLSPVTPLIPDPFSRPSSSGSPAFNHPVSDPLNKSNNENGSSMDVEAEEKAIKEKGFYLHPSPATTPREAEPPRLLPLFPVTSPRISGSANPSSS